MIQFNCFKCGKTERREEDDDSHTLFLDGICEECAEDAEDEE